MAARAIQGEHQLRAGALAEGVLAYERFELGYELAVSTQFEVCVDSVLDRCQPHLFEASDLRLRERLVGEVLKRRAAPKCKRPAQQLGSRGRLAGSQRITTIDGQPRELVEVELLRRRA